MLDRVSAMSISVLIIRTSRGKGQVANVAIEFPDARLYNPLRRFKRGALALERQDTVQRLRVGSEDIMFYISY